MSGSIFGTIRWGGTSAAALLLAGCSEPSELPSSQIFLLVDVSETWHNANDDDRNMRVLTETGMGAATAADRLASDSGEPVAVQLRIIGSNSLEREPVCDVIFRKQLISRPTDRVNELSSGRELREYLGENCPQAVLALPPEASTEISNAMISLSNQLTVQARNRKIVIMSDFLEEAQRPSTPVDLAGFSILMLYRPLQPDQADPDAMRTRITLWQNLFTQLGASVSVAPDTGIKREVVTDFLLSSPLAELGK